MRRIAPLLFALLLVPCPAPAASSGAPAAPRAPAASADLGRARAELFADRASVAPGGTFAVALAITLEEGWHTYWLNPGESGMAPRVKIECAMGARPRTGRTEWPAPRRFEADGMVTFGYAGSLTALHEFEVAPDQLPGEDIAVTASVQLLFCRETCEPGAGELAVVMPVERPARPDPTREAAFRAARERLPAPPSPAFGTVEATLRDGAIDLFLPSPAGGASPSDFFPLERGLLSPAARPDPVPARGGSLLRLPLDPNAGARPARLRGVLVERRDPSAPAFAIDVPLKIAR